ncbi:MAG TPA: 3' terminal RNA ribose 2'-O-methyltransferase Hen1 [Herpetosiphonaceae bacterium]
MDRIPVTLCYNTAPMFLTITNTSAPATDLGYLLVKHPERLHSFEASFGAIHVFYPEATTERCTAALLLDVDPVALVRGRPGTRGDGALLDQYVNDRPYVASSFLSVAIAQVLGSALAGKSKDRPELVETPLALEATIAVLPCRGGEGLLRRLFEPLGYTVAVERHLRDPQFPDWGESNAYTVKLAAHCCLQDLLAHLYVLVPVLDEEKHYWFGADEVEKLLRRGEGWLAKHPERDLITTRYLKRRHLVRAALARLIESATDPDAAEQAHDQEEQAVEERISLHTQRLGAVLAALKQCGARRVLDLGCGEGRLLQMLLTDRSFEQILGVDVAYRALEIARDRLRLDQLPSQQQSRISLIQSSLTYRDRRLVGYDAAAVVEVIEHLDQHRLAAFERSLFEFARPATVIITTPNAEYNVKWESLPAGKFRHRDHRFEWTRAEFQRWSNDVAARFGYQVRFLPIGPDDPAVGPPTQMGVLRATEPAA